MARKSSILKPADAASIESAIKTLSPAWTTAVLIHLSGGKDRTMQILDAIPGLTPKILNERLHTMMRHGFIGRQTFREVPSRTEYSLTDKGEKLLRLLESVKACSPKLINERMQ